MKTKLTILTLLICTYIYAQDIIVTVDSKKIESKIEEVSAEYVKYRKISNPDGPLFVISTSEIQLIVYNNGEVQTFNQIKEKETKKEAKTKVKSIVPKAENEKELHNGKEPKLTGYIEVGGMIGKETTRAITGYNVELSPVLGGLSLHGVLGKKATNWWFLGGGLGICAAFGNAERELLDFSMSITAVRLPLYMNSRFYIPVHSETFRPAAEVSIGLNIPITTVMNVTYRKTEEVPNEYGVSEVMAYRTTDRILQTGQLGAFFRVGIGGEYKQFIFGAGYELWGDKWDCDHYAYFKIGGRFGKK